MSRRIAVGLAAALLLTCLGLAPKVVWADEGSDAGSAVEQIIPFKRQEPPVSGAAPKVVFVLLMLLAGGVGGLIVLRRNLQKKGVIPAVNGSRITVVEMKRLSSKLNVFLLAVDGKEYLLLQGEGQIQIARHDKSPEAESRHGA